MTKCHTCGERGRVDGRLECRQCIDMGFGVKRSAFIFKRKRGITDAEALELARRYWGEAQETLDVQTPKPVRRFPWSEEGA